MTTRSLHDDIKVSRRVQITNLTGIGSPNQLTTGEVDLEGFDSAMFLVDFGAGG